MSRPLPLSDAERASAAAEAARQVRKTLETTPDHKH